MSGDVGNAAREPKHIDLYHTIDRLRLVVGRFQDLFDEMDNGPSPKNTGATVDPSSSIAFQGVYDGASGRIHEASDTLEKVLSELRSRLF